jgi:phage-related minor tail protein
MADRIYRTKLVLDTSAMQSGAAAADNALERVAGSTDALSRHLALAATAGSAFERQQQGLATAQARATAATQAQSSALDRLRNAAAAQAGVLGAPNESAGLQALAGIRSAAQAHERSEYQTHQQALAGIRQAANERERSQYQGQQQFLQGLQRQADTVGKTRSELLTLQAAQLGVTAQAAPMIARLAQGERQLGSFGKSGKLSAQELAQVSFQLNDLAVQVASGGNPLIALVQQGSQLSGTFGGIGGAARALGSLITPAVAGIGALAAGVGVLGIAYVQGQRDDQRFRDSIVLTGNAAGVTRGSFESMAATVQATTGVTISAARDITQQLIATGQIGPRALAAIAEAAGTLARVSGQSADEVVKDFSGMANGAARWAAEKNKAFNFLTAETYLYIKSLEAQGKLEEAMVVAANAFNDSVAGRTRNLGLLEQAWDKVTKKVSEFKNAVLSIGREDTSGDQAQQVIANLAVARERLALAEKRSSTGGGPDVERRRAIVAAFETQLETIRLQQRAEQAASQQSAATATKSKEELRRLDEAYQSASLGQQRSALNLAQAQAANGREAQQLANERAYDQGLRSLDEYVQARAQIERQAIEAKRAAIDQEIALERKRLPGSEPETLQQQSRINELLVRRTQLEAERLKLSDQVGRKFGKSDKPSPIEEAEAGFAKRIEQYRERNEAALDREVEHAQRAALELGELNKRLGVELIADDQARGQAQIAIEVAQQRARISALIEGTEGRKQAEADLAEFIRLRNQQLTEQLKPEWQRMLDGWADTTRLMRETHDRFITGFLERGEEAWLEFNRTGKLNLASVGKLIQDELARLTYRQFIAPAVAGIGKTIAGAIGIKVPGAAGDAGLAAAKTAEAAATVQATTAVSTFSVAGVSPATAALGLLVQAANAAAGALGQVAGGSAASGIGNLFGSFGLENLGGGGFGTGIDYGLQDLGLFLAKGGAFAGGKHVQPFARGGILGPNGGLLERPTVFPMKNGGLGLGGEAGTEAVMPLTKTAGGKLGVAAVGGSAAPVNVEVRIVNNGQPVKEQSRRVTRNNEGVLLEVVISAVADNIRRGGEVAQAGEATWGVSPAASAV